MKKVLIITLSIALLSACSQSPKEKLDALKKQHDEISAQIKSLEAEISKGESKKSKDKPLLVSITEVKPQTFQHFIEVQGRVDADQNIGVSAEMPGTITGILVSKGNTVSVGQVLATTDASTILAQIDAVKKNWELANTLYEKQKSLWEQQIGTEVQYLSAKNQKESLEKNLETLQKQYEMTKIKSPINGTVDEVYAKIGASVAPGYPAFQVVNFSLMKVKSDLSESYAGKVKVGDQVNITFPGSDIVLNKKVTAVSQVINPNSRSFAIDILLGNEDKQFFHPNMIAMLKICDYTANNAIAIPISLILNTESGKFVYIVKTENGNSIAQQQLVTTGFTYGDKVEILSGIKGGDQLITVGYQDLVNGQLVSFDTQVANK